MILHELIDYDTLKLIWWLLLGVLLIGFAVTDGFDLGVGALLPFVARTDVERRVAINTIGPVWEGNQVWLILAGGAIFAAWPPLYAVSFSGFYLAMFLVLAALILRPVGFKYRSKRDDPRWRNTWDWALFIGGFVPALIFGVAVGNVLQGVPFRFNEDLRAFYEGSLFGLLNPFALLCGLLSRRHAGDARRRLARAQGRRPRGRARARAIGSWAALATIGLFALGGLLVWLWLPGYRITSPSPIDPAMPSNPLIKTVTREGATWLANFATHPWMLIAPALGFLGAAGAFLGLQTQARGADASWRARRSDRSASSPTVGLADVPVHPAVARIDPGLEPHGVGFVVEPSDALHHAAWPPSSSCRSSLVYTAWVYRVLWGKVDAATIERENGHAY